MSRQIAAARDGDAEGENGARREIILVSSGAVAAGLDRLGWKARPRALVDLQAAAAVGQMALIDAYEAEFARHRLHAAQMLLTAEDLAHRELYLNARATLRRLLDLRVVPVVNENDAIAAADARLRRQRRSGGAIDESHRSRLAYFADRPRRLARRRRGNRARGGGRRRHFVAPYRRKTARGQNRRRRHGQQTARGQNRGAPPGRTRSSPTGARRRFCGAFWRAKKSALFCAAETPPLSARKRWLASGLSLRGELVVDDGAARAVRELGRSLLPAGIVAARGGFARGDAVRVVDGARQTLGFGLVNYTAAQIDKLRGRNSAEIKIAVGLRGRGGNHPPRQPERGSLSGADFDSARTPPRPPDAFARALDSFACETAAVIEAMRLASDSEIPLVNAVGERALTGGKRLRALVVVLAARAVGAPRAAALSIAAAIEFIHTATLLHDDVVDEAGLRRGRDSINRAFGNAAAVLVGDFFYSRASQMLAATRSPAILSRVADATNKLAEGEVLQLAKRGDFDISEESYYQIIERKTANLFELAAVAPALLVADNGQERALAAYGRALGIAFQLIDDCLDFEGDESEAGKSIGRDFAEGNITLPLILALAAAPARDSLCAELAAEGGGFARALDVVRGGGALAATRARARETAATACAALAPLLAEAERARAPEQALRLRQMQNLAALAPERRG